MKRNFEGSNYPRQKQPRLSPAQEIENWILDNGGKRPEAHRDLEIDVNNLFSSLQNTLPPINEKQKITNFPTQSVLALLVRFSQIKVHDVKNLNSVLYALKNMLRQNLITPEDVVYFSIDKITTSFKTIITMGIQKKNAVTLSYMLELVSLLTELKLLSPIDLKAHLIPPLINAIPLYKNHISLASSRNNMLKRLAFFMQVILFSKLISSSDVSKETIETFSFLLENLAQETKKDPFSISRYLSSLSLMANCQILPKNFFEDKATLSALIVVFKFALNNEALPLSMTYQNLQNSYFFYSEQFLTEDSLITLSESLFSLKKHLDKNKTDKKLTLKDEYKGLTGLRTFIPLLPVFSKEKQKEFFFIFNFIFQSTLERKAGGLNELSTTDILDAWLCVTKLYSEFELHRTKKIIENVEGVLTSILRRNLGIEPLCLAAQIIGAFHGDIEKLNPKSLEIILNNFLSHILKADLSFKKVEQNDLASGLNLLTDKKISSETYALFAKIRGKFLDVEKNIKITDESYEKKSQFIRSALKPINTILQNNMPLPSIGNTPYSPDLLEDFFASENAPKSKDIEPEKKRRYSIDLSIEPPDSDFMDIIEQDISFTATSTEEDFLLGTLPTGEQIQFKEIEMPDDNDCGFHSLEISRPQFIQALFSLSDDESARQFLSKEIEYSLKSEELHINGWDNLWETLQEKENRKNILFSELNRKYKQSFTTETIEEFIAYLKGHHYDNDAKSLYDIYLSVENAQKNIEQFCQTQTVYEAYVDSYLIPKRQWLGIYGALLYAKQTYRNLYIWRKSEKDNTLVLINHHISGEFTETTHMYYTGANTHFNALSPVNPSPSPLPVISVKQEPIREEEELSALRKPEPVSESNPDSSLRKPEPILEFRQPSPEGRMSSPSDSSTTSSEDSKEPDNMSRSKRKGHAHRSNSQQTRTRTSSPTLYDLIKELDVSKFELCLSRLSEKTVTPNTPTKNPENPFLRLSPKPQPGTSSSFSFFKTLFEEKTPEAITAAIHKLLTEHSYEPLYFLCHKLSSQQQDEQQAALKILQLILKYAGQSNLYTAISTGKISFRSLFQDLTPENITLVVKTLLIESQLYRDESNIRSLVDFLSSHLLDFTDIEEQKILLKSIMILIGRTYQFHSGQNHRHSAENLEIKIIEVFKSLIEKLTSAASRANVTERTELYSHLYSLIQTGMEMLDFARQPNCELSFPLSLKTRLNKQLAKIVKNEKCLINTNISSMETRQAKIIRQAPQDPKTRERIYSEEDLNTLYELETKLQALKLRLEELDKLLKSPENQEATLSESQPQIRPN